ncbi:hypothetical protein DYU11_20810 [Fibrisoma montanum]|uniref:Uncharacterized protein n=1 Tax=Fibrisoma montanum TaxID=2305895 RepID=A0A418M425_9BACT|nr:hypothetical protein [Fibrisoma montanum]RIV20490.1 hypothetical protein DYU11_20810 [Fibrisoma montanum]
MDEKKKDVVSKSIVANQSKQKHFWLNGEGEPVQTAFLLSTPFLSNSMKTTLSTLLLALYCSEPG